MHPQVALEGATEMGLIWLCFLGNPRYLIENEEIGFVLHNARLCLMKPDFDAIPFGQVRFVKRVCQARVERQEINCRGGVFGLSYI
jgi:hypothetical protein